MQFVFICFFFYFFDLIIEIEQENNIVNNSKSIIVILKNVGYNGKLKHINLYINLQFVYNNI